MSKGMSGWVEDDESRYLWIRAQEKGQKAVRGASGQEEVAGQFWTALVSV
jgi:hypothetical protein